MENSIREEIRRFALESPANLRRDGEGRFFDEPLVGFAAADDPLFASYKEIIGPFHLTPQELMANAFGGAEGRAATVVCWLLPIVRETRESNRRERQWPSRQWAETRSSGEAFNVALRRHLVDWLAGRGQRALAPQLAAEWHQFDETPVGIASNWSERHAAYAAGLGTFSLNDALISERGIAHRIGSIITELELPATPRPYSGRASNCLYYRQGGCGVCIGRCPTGAISWDGHDKEKCRAYVYEAAPKEVGIRYGVSATGCGLCQTVVPCEAVTPK